MKKRSLIVRLFTAIKISVLCLNNGLNGSKHYRKIEHLSFIRFWSSFIRQTIIDLCSIFFHEFVPDPYQQRYISTKYTVLFLPGYSMTANSASPLLSNICSSGYKVVTSRKRMLFRNVRSITRWVYEESAKIQLNGQTPILLGYSMGGDITQRVANKMDLASISISTPIATQHTFFSALDMILKDGSSFRKNYKDCYGVSLSESFSFHIPRPDQECHTTISGVHSHFAVNNPDVIKAVIDKIKEISDESYDMSELPRNRLIFCDFSTNSAEIIKNQVKKNV